MPTVLQVGPYNFIFIQLRCEEPAHIHVKRDRQLTKFWLNPVSLEKNRGFKEHELNQIAKLVEEHQTILLSAWHDYFDS
jgi:heme-degrading monooxygenase HmoA